MGSLVGALYAWIIIGPNQQIFPPLHYGDMNIFDIIKFSLN